VRLACPRRAALGVALLAVLVALAPGRAAAGTVVLLRSGTLGAYQEAAQGFRRMYTGPLVELQWGAMDSKEIERRILRERPDAVVAVGLRAAVFCRDRLTRIPVVYCAVENPEEHDLVGAWITGVCTEVSPEDELAALREAVPDVRRVGFFFGPVAGAHALDRARAAAAASGIELVEAPVANLGELAHTARDLAPRVDALWMPADPVLATPEAFHFLLELSLRTRRPLFVFSDALVRAGAYAGLEPDFGRAGERAAQAVHRIRAGERAGDIPVAREKEARLVINQSTARAIGRDVPRGLAGPVEVVP
jgi:putative tryptophan/tyrosine transport system substrate-binding protein